MKKINLKKMLIGLSLIAIFQFANAQWTDQGTNTLSSREHKVLIGGTNTESSTIPLLIKTGTSNNINTVPSIRLHHVYQDEPNLPIQNLIWDIENNTGSLTLKYNNAYVLHLIKGTTYTNLSLGTEFRFMTTHNIIFTGTGNVGIGTSNPTALLTVNGKIEAEEIEVKDIAADYVFEENYSLMSLSELENYIKVNKHLPNIAPAIETEKGVNLGEFNEKLLEKVEELTLYVIQLEKKLNEIEKNSK